MQPEVSRRIVEERNNDWLGWDNQVGRVLCWLIGVSSPSKNECNRVDDRVGVLFTQIDLLRVNNIDVFTKAYFDSAFSPFGCISAAAL